MGAQGDARRRAITARGRPMMIRRGTAPAVSFLGFDRQYQPGELVGGIAQGDLRLELLASELDAAGFGLPKNPDRVTMDGRTFTVMGARAVREGAAVIGYSLWLRGA